PPEKKGSALRCPFSNPCRVWLRRRGSLGLGRGFALHRPGVRALGLDVAIDELDHRDRRGIAVAEARLANTGVAAVAVLVAGAERLEQLLDHRDVAHLGDRLTAGVEVAALAERHQFLDDRTQVLRLRQRGHDLLVLDQRRRHVGEHGAAMLVLAVELAVGVTVTHVRLRMSDARDQMPRGPRGTCHLTSVSNDPRSAWPARRYCRAASPALPCRGGAPSGPALP